MWSELSKTEKDEYRKMILAFASLTDMFSQKNDDEDIIPSPIINSKYQETVFQRVFHASPEDIGNTSFDASLCITRDNGTKKKYLIGIKTFGISSGDQKIAQFKANHNDWSNILDEIQQNSINPDGNRKTKQEIDLINHTLYKKLATEISLLRNLRISSSISNLQGFSVIEGKDDVEAIYHVLMPSKKGETPCVFVGETSYQKIDIDNITIRGCTKADNPTNFCFNDGNHKYKFTSADSQLLMTFNNRDIVLDTWPVTYAEDAYSVFHDISDRLEKTYNHRIGTEELLSAEPEMFYSATSQTESYSWLIPVERYSGFNNFYGVGSKLASSERESRINKFESCFHGIVSEENLRQIVECLRDFLLDTAQTDSDRKHKEECRNQIINIAKATNNADLLSSVSKLVYRPVDEMYIPIPKAREFHLLHPNFFGQGIGTFDEGSSKLKNDKEHCSFNLVFEPSGEKIRAFITQDNGKAIESWDKQSILGNWLKKYVFQLNDYEPLTIRRLEELGINGMRLYKTSSSNDIHLQFIDINSNSLPTDFLS